MVTAITLNENTDSPCFKTNNTINKRTKMLQILRLVLSIKNFRYLKYFFQFTASFDCDFYLFI